MRITFVLPSLPRLPAGGFKVVYQYSNELVRRGHRVTIVHPRTIPGILPPANLYRWLRWRGGRVRDYLFNPKPNWVKIDRRVQMSFVLDLASQHLPDADVVFATAWNTAQPVLDLPEAKGRKFYLIQHYETWSGFREMVDATWRFPLYKVVIARWLYQKGVELGCDEKQMGYVRIGINHDVFNVVESIEQRSSKIAMMFSPQEWKGSAEGLKALEIAKADRSNLQAILFGMCPRPKSIPAWVEYWYKPSQAELAQKIYNSSSIYLCSSWFEGWPAPPAEAMACGCAVASTDCGGIREYGIPEINALLSPTRDPESLAANIERLLRNDDLRMRIARMGCEHIKKFTWDRSADELEGFVLQHI